MPRDALSAFELSKNMMSAAKRFRKGLENWFRCMQVCIEANGKYFEKIKKKIRIETFIFAKHAECHIMF